MALEKNLKGINAKILQMGASKIFLVTNDY